MSAYVHGTDHIDLLASAFFEFDARGIVRYDDQGARLNSPRVIDKNAPASSRGDVIDGKWIGQLLLSENIRSVLYRYSNVDADERAEYAALADGYTFHKVPLFQDLNGQDPAGVVIAACISYGYQSCETPNYDETEAAAVIDGIFHAAVRRLRPVSAAMGTGWSFTRPADLPNVVSLMDMIRR